jgi:hypothetical protein
MTYMHKAGFWGMYERAIKYISNRKSSASRASDLISNPPCLPLNLCFMFTHTIKVAISSQLFTHKIALIVKRLLSFYGS